MDWSSGLRFPFIPRQESSFSFMCNYNYDEFPVLEMKQQAVHQGILPGLMEKGGGSAALNMNYGGDPKKKRLSNEQLELLENSFLEEVKLEPDRKLKLSKELGLQPRQIAVWFQNRRARWKGKQLERLYDALKQEYDAVLKEKQKLQQEVMALRAILKDQLAKKQVSTGQTDQVSGEETVESTLIPSSEKLITDNQIPECSNYELNVDDYNGNLIIPATAYWPPPQLPREVVNGDY